MSMFTLSYKCTQYCFRGITEDTADVVEPTYITEYQMVKLFLADAEGQTIQFSNCFYVLFASFVFPAYFSCPVIGCCPWQVSPIGGAG